MKNEIQKLKERIAYLEGQISILQTRPLSSPALPYTPPAYPFPYIGDMPWANRGVVLCGVDAHTQ